MGGANARDYERLRPCGPVFYERFVAEVSMKLVKRHAFPGRLRRDLLRVKIGVLPGPSHFDQVLFCAETHPKRNSITRAIVEHNARVCPGDVRLNRKAYAGAITQECSGFKTQRLWLRFLLRAEGK
jgi:hypothetical protein